MNEDFDRSFARFRTFLKTEPVVPILSRNLSFLLAEPGILEGVEVNDGLRCCTRDRKAVVGGARFLMREDFLTAHWTAAMRVLLAHEVQHDNSSDKAVLAQMRRLSGRMLRERWGLDEEAGEIIGHKIFNAMEDGRIDNIVCRRFPGYVPMVRFTNFARREGMKAHPGKGGGAELVDFLDNLWCFALTGLAMPGAEGYRGTAFESAFIRLIPAAESAVTAETAEECGELSLSAVEKCGEYVARLCMSGDFENCLREISGTLEDYAFSEEDRREQFGDGENGGARIGNRRPDGRSEKNGEAGSDEETPGDRQDSGSPGSGDNSTRQIDESGSLTDEEAKPKNGAGSSGREDRGVSYSSGRSENHGATGGGEGMNNSLAAASETAREDGPQSISEVLGAGFGSREAPPLTDTEIEDMLEAAGRELERERSEEKKGRADKPQKTGLSQGNAEMLASLYSGVSFSEILLEPQNRRLPPEYMDEAKRLHKKLDRILKEQHARTEGQRRGALSRKALWRSEVNDPDIFCRKLPPTRCQSAFCLLIDRSGSMGTGFGNGNSKLFTALLTAAVIEEALKGLAFTKAVAFDGGPDEVRHTVIKDFDQKPVGNRCFDALGQVSAGNGNKDGCSIRIAAMDLEKRAERRKVLIVLSDGLPSAYIRESEAIGDVRSAVQDARRRGIIVIPIMYGADDADSIYDSYLQMYETGVICTTPENILSELEKLLFRLIR